MGHTYTKVVGTTFYEVPWEQLLVGQRIYAKREPDNQYDSQAIGLWVMNKQTREYARIGHLSRAFIAASGMDIWMDSGNSLTIVIASLTGGTEGKENRGINIEVRQVPKATALKEVQPTPKEHPHPFRLGI